MFDSIHKYTEYKKKIQRRGPIILEEQVAEQNNLFQQFDKLSDKNTDNHGILCNNQRRYTRHTQSISSKRQ